MQSQDHFAANEIAGPTEDDDFAANQLAGPTADDFAAVKTGDFVTGAIVEQEVATIYGHGSTLGSTLGTTPTPGTTYETLGLTLETSFPETLETTNANALNP